VHAAAVLGHPAEAPLTTVLAAGEQQRIGFGCWAAKALGDHPADQ
jgi:hypothetical protein